MVGGAENDVAIVIADAVEGDDLPIHVFLHDVLLGELQGEEMVEFRLIMQSVGIRRAHADVGFDEDGIADLFDEGLGFFFVLRPGDEEITDRLRPAFLEIFLHPRFRGDAVHVLREQAIDAEPFAEPGVAAEPPLVHRFDVVDLPVFLLVILHRFAHRFEIVHVGDEVILGAGA